MGRMKRNMAKRAEWRRRLQKFEKSGLSARAFAEREGVAVQTVHRWRRQLKSENAELAFVRVDMADSSESVARIEVAVGDVAVRVKPDFSPELLRQVVSALAPV